MKKSPKVTEFERVELNVPARRERLSPREMGRGVYAVHRNMRRLFSDAVLLLGHRRYPAAVATALQAHEESAKPLTIGMLTTDPAPSPLALRTASRPEVRRHFWAEFRNHERKHLATRNAHLSLGGFPAHVRERLERVKATDVAETYVTLRERCTFVDSVQRAERWTTPEALVDADFALLLLRGIRKSIQRILTPAELAEGLATVEMAPRVCSPERLAEVLAWSKTDEANELSRIDREEQAQWIAETDAALAALGEPEKEQAARSVDG